ncbi:hypothetical protein [Undibacterium sp.]|uniref:hypothetical protein n=1 Tax=Undibacterium sp. TaxID=1914977 RepID=UPI0025E7CA33|nr:hypothetical protein [Undibacterium sp.]
MRERQPKSLAAGADGLLLIISKPAQFNAQCDLLPCHQDAIAFAPVATYDTVNGYASSM